MTAKEFNPDRDRVVVEALSSVASSMSEIGLPGRDLRENKHLAPLAKTEFEGLDLLVGSRRLRTPAFPRLGPVDVVIEDLGILMELKWSYNEPNKIFESVWDAIKLAILGTELGYDNLYVVTGASSAAWELTECGDLFETGTLNALEIWGRRLASRRGPNSGRTVCEDLIIGASGAQPAEGPENLEVRALDSFKIGDNFELRLAAIEPARELLRWPSLDLLSGNAVPWAASVDLDEVEIDLLLAWLASQWADLKGGRPFDGPLARLDDKLRDARPRN